MEKQEKLRKAETVLLDILRGYSILKDGDQTVYFKHFTLLDSLAFEEYYRNTLDSAKKSGIKDEETIINQAIKSKKWSVKQEEEIKSLIWTIDKLSAASKKISDRFQRKSAEENVKSKKEELAELQKARREVCSYSAENFAETKKVKNIILSSLYEDSDFKTRITEKDLDDFTRLFFDKISELNNNELIVAAAYNTSFFEVFTLNYRTPHVLLDKVGMEMTVFQKNLFVYANAILNKLKNVDIPEAILNDGLKVLEYKEVEKDTGKKTSVGLDDLKEKSAKSGGKLTPEDFLT